MTKIWVVSCVIALQVIIQMAGVVDNVEKSPNVASFISQHPYRMKPCIAAQNEAACAVAICESYCCANEADHYAEL